MRSIVTITGVVSLAALSLCAAGAVALFGAGPASALPSATAPGASPARQVSAPARQVSGSVLQTALLPASDFGAGFSTVASGSPNSGNRVLRPSPGINPAILGCTGFESVVFLEAFGQTAGALASFTNPAWQAGNPDIWDGQELVDQFASPQAAATFYHRAYAKYEACQPLTVPQPSDTTLGGGELDLSTMSITKTTVAGYPAFEQIQFAARSETSGWTFFRNTLTVIAGPDVYQILDYSGTDDEPAPALMTELIHRIQQLR
jgi:hypothetical protein